MREIIFRGKYLGDGNWVDGYLYVTHDGTCEIGKYNEQYRIERYTYIVNPDSVGQYTGRKDRNGKKIFEGDIMRGAMGKYVVSYFDAGFDWERVGDKHYGGESFTGFSDEYEVIGNIHDNPDLLEVVECGTL